MKCLSLSLSLPLLPIRFLRLIGFVSKSRFFILFLSHVFYFGGVISPSLLVLLLCYILILSYVHLLCSFVTHHGPITGVMFILVTDFN